MAHDILADLGELFLGSRLKRLAERLQGDAARVAQAAGIDIQPAQFPLLAAIDRYGPLTVGDAVEALGISQPAVTRTATGLIEIGLLAAERSGSDLRQKRLVLTAAGTAAMQRAKTAMWPQLDGAVRELCGPVSGSFLAQIAQIEAGLDAMPLEARARRWTPGSGSGLPEARMPGLAIREYDDSLAEDFHRINAEWISSMFALEDNDVQILTRPRELIVDRGGLILFVEAEGLGIVGTCALIRIADGVFELTKMGVLESARGRKAGEYLLAAMLERAGAMAAETLYLLTSVKCASAIHLYEKLGFVHDAGIMRDHGSRYARCDVAMRYRPQAALR
ncbi:bifunctional helix-turn-helix transcriptional regulator/GNAT family N-acetyltransferase [Sphingomonas abietis]|uniref:Bifunctional helix-turn-helix transcriptional regulator/GNAT family N-acetyltransferase n=1 Tax=Sphingomonas abietis TaxID=3012344 RepID=A0ABY7NK90_9SPHN|nr:bifunctional helix-turn-helix transcriptional regulator/GNAT family N-acetyltransferase [Sphingomonas abietis]WBO21904.1 bifunctional helix-turn-helix transcriptional regulator/GNAT family N-acetyltransferase [Sphingomonas abietis]